MTERDRVFDAFRNCITEPKCKDCPWTECETIDHGTIEIPRDLALAVMRELAAQEPRVMTLEDVKEGEAYWLEMRGIASEYAICKLNDHGDSAFLDFAVQFGGKTLESDGYGKTWRCWSVRPTDEQREAAAWMT